MTQRRRPWRLRAIFSLIVAAGLVGVLACTPRAANSADPNALWHIVHDLCVPDMNTSGLPAPCSAVDLAGRYAVLKDIRGTTQLLLIPTDRVVGIESAQLLAADAPNYWQDAWDSKPLFEKRAGQQVPREDLGLAINSIDGRSQNQLHIHIDCVRPDVQKLLAANEARIGHAWSDLHADFPGRHYRGQTSRGRRLRRAAIRSQLLAEDGDAASNMGSETLVVIGAVFADGQPGFWLLSDRSNLALLDKGHGEELLDHRCRVLGLNNPAAGD